MASPVSSTTAAKTAPSTASGPTKSIAIVGLVFNIVLLPGLGTVIWGRRAHGVWQIALTILGVVGYVAAAAVVELAAPDGSDLPLSMLLLLAGSVLLLVATWIWSIVSGVKMVKNARPD